MSDEYPSEDILEIIKNWDIIKQGYQGLLDIIKDNWWNGDMGGFRQHGIWLQLHTWGWSGNEDIMSAIESGRPGLMIFWRKSIVGGHYYFKLHPMFRYPQKEEPKKVQIQ